MLHVIKIYQIVLVNKVVLKIAYTNDIIHSTIKVKNIFSYVILHLVDT